MIICFTARVSDGRNANLEEVRSLGFLAVSFHCALTFHVVPLQRLRAGEACFGNSVDGPQIAPLNTPPQIGWTTDLNLTLTLVAIQYPKVMSSDVILTKNTSTQCDVYVTLSWALKPKLYFIQIISLFIKLGTYHTVRSQFLNKDAYCAKANTVKIPLKNGNFP